MNCDEVHSYCQGKFNEIDRDLKGAEGGEWGLRKKTNILWTEHLKHKDVETKRKVSADRILVIVSSLLQSGLLVYLISGGKLS